METIFIPTPIDVKPEKEGWYVLIKNSEVPRDIAYYRHSGWDIRLVSQRGMAGPIYNYSHWLKPVSKSEYDREIAKKAFDAGQDYHHYSDGPGLYAPDLETYLSKL